VPVAFAHFAVVFPQPAARQPLLAPVVTFLGLFMSGLAFSPWIVAGVRLSGKTTTAGAVRAITCA
jgi:hypothetical protein